MKIEKSMLKTLWYEDEDGKEIKCDEDEVDPKGAAYFVSRFPLCIRTKYYRLIKQENVDKCTHDRKYITHSNDCTDDYEKRICNFCGGTQVRKKGSSHWPKKWQAYGSRLSFEFESTANDQDTIIAMVNSGDYTLSEALIVYSEACERCMNVLVYKYTNCKDGYPEFSDEWKKAGTCCQFCKDEGFTRPYRDEDCIKPACDTPTSKSSKSNEMTCCPTNE